LARIRSGAAGLVLQAEEGRFRGLVEHLARNVITMRLEELSGTKIYLGSATPAERGYSVRAEVPRCWRQGGRGTASVAVGASGIELEVNCGGAPPAPLARHGIALIDAGKLAAYTTPGLLYGLYRLLYRDLGAGAGVLRRLAVEARKKNDAEVAGVLERLCEILGVSSGIVGEVEREDPVRAVAEEVKGRAEEALHLLRAAKEAARRGDTERLERLLSIDIIVAGRVRISLGDIVHHLAGERNSNVAQVLYYPVITAGEHELSLVDIYGVFVEAAERLGLEVQKTAQA